MALLREPLLLLSRLDTVKKAVTTLPGASSLVERYVPGESTAEAVEAASRLAEEQMLVSLDFLGEDTLDENQAEVTVEAYLELLAELSRRGLATRSEVSVKLTAIGLALPGGEAIALENARRIALAARNAGSLVTIDMEDHTRTDATLETVAELRKDHPDVGLVLQAQLRRTEEDARAFAHEGSRVRLCKGAYAEPDDVVHRDAHAVDLAFVRCLRTLMRGAGHPMIATHDPRLIAIAQAMAAQQGRDRGSFEFQMLYGIRPEEQRRLAAQGETMRVYVPYGVEWYGYLMRRLAERPRNLALFTKSLTSKK